MIEPVSTVKTFGIVVGLLFFGYAFAITKLSRYDSVSDKYARGFGIVATLLILVAVGGFTSPPTNWIAESAGYLVAALGGTVAFRYIANNQQHFKKA